VAEALAQTAEIARAEQQHWGREVSEANRQLARWSYEPDSGRGVVLAAKALGRLDAALQRQLLQHACESLQISPTFEQVEAVRELLSRGGGVVELPRGVRAVREHDELRLWVSEAKGTASGYEYPLPLPGEVSVPEAGLRLRTHGVVPRLESDKGRDGSSLVVRNWRPGDRFYPQHSKGPKKVKELLTEKKITGRERALWPVVAAGERVVWLRGWGVAADAVATTGSEGVRIEEVNSAG
jgi:tRNA(Ile)-lysidine synthase